MSNRPKLAKKTHAPAPKSYAHLSNLHLAKQISRIDTITMADNNSKLTKFGRQQRVALHAEKQSRINDGTW